MRSGWRTCVREHLEWLLLRGLCYRRIRRSIVGWCVSNSLHADLVLDALQMAIWRRRRQDLTGLEHHNDRGVRTGFKGSSQHCSQELRRSNAKVDAQIAHFEPE